MKNHPQVSGVKRFACTPSVVLLQSFFQSSSIPPPRRSGAAPRHGSFPSSRCPDDAKRKAPQMRRAWEEWWSGDPKEGELFSPDGAAQMIHACHVFLRSDCLFQGWFQVDVFGLDCETKLTGFAQGPSSPRTRDVLLVRGVLRPQVSGSEETKREAVKAGREAVRKERVREKEKHGFWLGCGLFEYCYC